MMSLRQKLLSLLPTRIKIVYSQSNDRSKLAVKNIFVSLLMKFANIISSFLIIPLTINYVNPTRYGIWLTLSSIIGWIVFFDLGLGNGFRNKFAEAKALGNIDLARKYLSTTYFIVTIIVIIVVSISILFNSLIKWSNILNIDPCYDYELSLVFKIVIFFTGANMVVGVFSTLLAAEQKPALSSVISAIGQYLSLLVIYIMTRVSNGNLVNLALFYSGIPCIVMLFSSIFMFKFSRLKRYTPSLSLVDFKLVKSIFGLGIKFFVVYLCLILIFQIINLVITRELGAIEVTKYNIAYKYFSVLYMILNIMLTPMWSAFTDAYVQKDYIWMANMIKKFERIWCSFIPISLLMLLLSNHFYSLWIGESVDVPFLLSFFMMLYILSQCLGAVYMYMINGIGTVFLQMVIYLIFASCSWIVLTYTARNFGIVGIILVPTIVYLVQAFVAKIQLKKILSKKAKGIWVK